MTFLPAYAAMGYLVPLDTYFVNNPILSTLEKKYFSYIPVKGKTYYIPYCRPMHKFIWMRNDLKSKFGINLSSTPTTEEFYQEMLKAVGQGVIPFPLPKFVDNRQFFHNSFGAYVNAFPRDETGKIIEGFNTRQAREALIYIKRLNDSGIMPLEYGFSDPMFSHRELLPKAQAFAGLDYFNRYMFYSLESAKAGKATECIPIYKLIGPRGEGGTLNEAIQDAFVVSAQCQNPQAAVDFIAWLNFTPEGKKLMEYGIHGKHYRVENGIGVSTEKARSSVHRLDPNAMVTSFVDLDLEFQWDFVTQQNLPRALEIARECQQYAGPAFYIPLGISEKLDQQLPNIKKTREEISAKIVLGKVSMEEGFAEYNKFWESIGGDEILHKLNEKLG